MCLIAENVQLAVGRDLEESELDTVELGCGMIPHKDVARATAVQLGPLYLRVSRSPKDKDFWMMLRYGSDITLRTPRFGIFKQAFKHIGLDGRERLMIKGVWYEKADATYHPIIRAPMCSIDVDDTLCTICLASDVAPIHCFPMRDKKEMDLRRNIMCTDDSWHLLTHLGFAAIP